MAGHIMALKNRERGEWVVSFLDIRPEDHVLEIELGPGVDVRCASRLALRGKVAGIDSSALMVRLARRRSSDPIAGVRVDLRLGDAMSV